VPDHGNESISEGHREYDYLGWIARLDLLPVKLFTGTRDFPREVVHSSITETGSKEKFRPNIFRVK